MVQSIQNTIQTKIEKLRERSHRMNEYLSMKQIDGDYHAVADAAMDIREYEAACEAYEDVLKLIKEIEQGERK